MSYRKLIAILGITAVAGGVASTTVEGQQTTYFATHGKYRQYAPDELKKGARVDEYQSPKGFGYQVLEEETREDGIYQRSYGSGPESKDRSFDWVKVRDIATST